MTIKETLKSVRPTGISSGHGEPVEPHAALLLNNSIACTSPSTSSGRTGKLNQLFLKQYAIALLLFSTMLAFPAQASEVLGRLFLTPAKRTQLEQQRAYNLEEQKTLEGSTVRLDGVVVRSSGKKTVWINGRTQHDSSNELGVNAQVAPGNPAQVGISDGSSSTRLRVGQQINRATREVQDGIEGGKLEVNPPPLRR
jgi:hypothetical protein